MGEHADDEMARQMSDEDVDDDDGQVGYWHAQRHARREERRAQLAAAESYIRVTRQQLVELGLTLEQKSPYHFHVVRIEGNRRTVVAQWWPSSGKTMDGNRRGQRCNTGKALVAWMRDKQREQRGAP